MSTKRLASASLAALLALTLTPLTSTAATSSYGVCDSVVNKALRNGAIAAVPARGTSISCYLELNQSKFNSATIALQRGILHGEGIYVDMDGYYGPATIAAVKKIQRKYGLVVDGEYGPKTGGAMRWHATNGTRSTWR